MADLKRYYANIKGKQYLMVEGRLVQAHEDFSRIDITTELVGSSPFVIFKATVQTERGTFTGWSAANPEAKSIEGDNPYEVAETSAIGRALKHAGVAIDAGVSAQEMSKAGYAGEKSAPAPQSAPRADGPAQSPAAAQAFADLETWRKKYALDDDDWGLLLSARYGIGDGEITPDVAAKIVRELAKSSPEKVRAFLASKREGAKSA